MNLNVLFLGFFYAQPIFIGVFLWSIGMTLKEDPLIEKGQGVVALGFGIAFILLSYHMLSMAGTKIRRRPGGFTHHSTAAGSISPFCSLVRLPMALQATYGAIIQKYLDGAVIKDDDEEEESKPKGKRTAKPAKDDED